MKNRLINKLDICSPGHLSDEYLAMAYTIEDSLLSAGAIPGDDYTILDLYKLAQPFALEIFKIKEKIEYDYAATKVL